MKTARRPSAFTLIELLVVISILGILAALSVPALKNLGKANIQTSASRQLLDDVGRARQLAINNHTTVYMVFLTTNFWQVAGSFPNAWYNSLTSVQLTAVTNLLDKQLTGYTFVSYGKLGDQPGQHQWRYLSPWQALPQGNMIAPWKFSNPNQPFVFSDQNNGYFSISNFDYISSIPFPNETNVSGITLPSLPYIAFNYLGQLVSSANDRDAAGTGADIPLAQGNVGYALDPATKIPLIPTTPLLNAISELPPGNSTNISYNIIHIDALTGRATLEYYKIK